MPKAAVRGPQRLSYGADFHFHHWIMMARSKAPRGRQYHASAANLPLSVATHDPVRLTSAVCAATITLGVAAVSPAYVADLDGPSGLVQGTPGSRRECLCTSAPTRSPRRCGMPKAAVRGPPLLWYGADMSQSSCSYEQKVGPRHWRLRRPHAGSGLYPHRQGDGDCPYPAGGDAGEDFDRRAAGETEDASRSIASARASSRVLITPSS